MPKLDLASIPVRKGSSYPTPFDKPVASRVRRALGEAGGLTEFGVNLVELPPGCWSSQRHWHSEEEEFAYVVSGEVTSITDAGEEVLRAGDCLCFPKGVPNAHHLINRSNANATLLVVGTRRPDDVCTYPDIDMRSDAKDEGFTHLDGTPYPPRG